MIKEFSFWEFITEKSWWHPWIIGSDVEARSYACAAYTHVQVSHFIDVDLSVFPHKVMSDVCQLLTVDLNTLGAKAFKVGTSRMELQQLWLFSLP